MLARRIGCAADGTQEQNGPEQHAETPGAVTVVRENPYEVAAFLRVRPASALPGIGPKTTKTLARYGIMSVGDIAGTQLPTLQHILATLRRAWPTTGRTASTSGRSSRARPSGP
ncbi:hypothetical protein [Streptomyces sp. NPDC002746]